MRDKLNKELKLDIALLILTVVCSCIFVACIVVIAISGQEALAILAQCTPWFILVAMTVFFTCVFVCMIKRDVNIAFNIEEGKRDLMKQEYEERLKRLMAQGVKASDIKASADQIKGTEDPDKKKVK